MKAECVLGPPGTGKTTHLHKMLNGLLSDGCDLNDITFISHTTAAAGEILSRIGLPRSDKVCTLHALCFRLLKLSTTSVINNRMLQQFEGICNVPISGRRAEDEGQEMGDMYLDIINYARNKKIGYDDAYYQSDRPGTHIQFEYFYQSYAAWKKSMFVIDYTDMLEKFIENPLSDKSKVLIVDEAQDLSNLQWEVIDTLINIGDYESVVIAGDDDQSIYIWGGADFDGMKKFSEKYNAKVLVLDQSYRIPRVVHELSQNLIGRVTSRMPKEYKPRTEEGKVNFYGDFEYVEFDEPGTMVLARTHRIVHEMEQTLIDKKIPYRKHGGRPGMLENRYAVAIRVLNKINRGDNLTKSEIEIFNKVCYNRYMDGEDAAGKMFYEVLDMPPLMVEYYSAVNVDAVPMVNLSTIHAAKGKEADRVVLATELTPRIAESMTKNEDEEIRVFYVGMTRAKHRLDIVDSGEFDIIGDKYGNKDI